MDARRRHAPAFGGAASGGEGTGGAGGRAGALRGRGGAQCGLAGGADARARPRATARAADRGELHIPGGRLAVGAGARVRVAAGPGPGAGAVRPAGRVERALRSHRCRPDAADHRARRTAASSGRRCPVSDTIPTNAENTEPAPEPPSPGTSSGAAAATPVPKKRKNRSWRRILTIGLLTIVALAVLGRVVIAVAFPLVLRKVAAAYDMDASYSRMELYLLGGDVGLWDLTIRPKAGGAPLMMT